MATTIKLVLPFPPSVNDYWGSRVVMRPGKRPFIQTFLPKRGKQFKTDVEAIVRAKYPRLTPTKRRVSVHYRLVAPDRRIRDLSNFLKGVEDALTKAGFWEDDSQIDAFSMERGPIEKPGRIEVEITALD
ncbi:RusA family crossover junction endodeoxyribonuclease [bacterium]|nr:RusA family crossover junction endodeoxyribonuclease [bacterium]